MLFSKLFAVGTDHEFHRFRHMIFQHGFANFQNSFTFVVRVAKGDDISLHVTRNSAEKFIHFLCESADLFLGKSIVFGKLELIFSTYLPFKRARNALTLKCGTSRDDRELLHKASQTWHELLT